MTGSYHRHLRMLQYALRGNAVFSTLSALYFIAFADSLAAAIAIGPEVFVGLGINLGVFAIILVLAATRRALARWWGLAVAALIVLLDVGWVLGSVLIASLPSYVTESGWWLIIGIAAVVGLLALLQGYALARIVWVRYRADRTTEEDAGREAPSVREDQAGAQITLCGLGLVLLLGGCSAADLRTSELKTQRDVDAWADKGETLLLQVAERHGLDAWQAHETLQATGTDYWADGAPGWWPLQNQRLQLTYALGTFTSQAQLLDGERAGEIWGIHAWQPYCQEHAGQPAELEAATGEMTAKTFYLPALHYFNELPFRLLNAEHIVYAGERTHRGQRYHLVLATWGSLEPNEQYDQYLLWINTDTLLVEMCHYTVRDAGSIFTGTIHFDDYRDVQGVLFPFEQTVTLPPPERTLYPLDRYYFHRLVFESAAFDAVDKQSLLIASGEEPQDAKHSE